MGRISLIQVDGEPVLLVRTLEPVQHIIGWLYDPSILFGAVNETPGAVGGPTEQFDLPSPGDFGDWCYEQTFAVTEANVLALRAAGFEWTWSACQAVDHIVIAAEAVDEVRKRVLCRFEDQLRTREERLRRYALEHWKVEGPERAASRADRIATNCREQAAENLDEIAQRMSAPKHLISEKQESLFERCVHAAREDYRLRNAHRSEPTPAVVLPYEVLDMLAWPLPNPQANPLGDGPFWDCIPPTRPHSRRQQVQRRFARFFLHVLKYVALGPLVALPISGVLFLLSGVTELIAFASLSAVAIAFPLAISHAYADTRGVAWYPGPITRAFAGAIAGAVPPVLLIWYMWMCGVRFDPNGPSQLTFLVAFTIPGMTLGAVVGARTTSL